MASLVDGACLPGIRYDRITTDQGFNRYLALIRGDQSSGAITGCAVISLQSSQCAAMSIAQDNEMLACILSVQCSG